MSVGPTRFSAQVDSTKARIGNSKSVIGGARRSRMVGIASEAAKGKKIPEICKLLEITDQTYYRWRQKYGGMQPEMAKQLKALQKENARLKKLVAEQALDMEILKEASQGNW